MLPQKPHMRTRIGEHACTTHRQRCYQGTHYGRDTAHDSHATRLLPKLLSNSAVALSLACRRCPCSTCTARPDHRPRLCPQYGGDEGYINLEKHLEGIENETCETAPSGRLFYLALPPSVYPQVGPTGCSCCTAAKCPQHKCTSASSNRLEALNGGRSLSCVAVSGSLCMSCLIVDECRRDGECMHCLIVIGCTRDLWVHVMLDCVGFGNWYEYQPGL
jgi:hypothetical protein